MNKAILFSLLSLLIGVAAAQDQRRLYFDQAHGELRPPPRLTDIAAKLHLELVNIKEPISPATLQGARILYLRAPSKAFVPEEREAIVNFVNHGGSLLVVLDEEKRQSLAVTHINDFLAPFGLHYTLDTPYLPNPGAIAKAGEINRADREIPYDGGRSAEGGTPFAFQLDKDGNPAQPYGAWKKVDCGGRIVVLAEGMASLFLGSPNGRRLVRVDDNAGPDLYWGKDSAIFMEEVLSWLTPPRP